jgi:hypothetical protein
MIARMEVELARAALLTGIEVPAHDRGAAMGDGPDGAPFRPVQRGFSTQELRHETTQHPDDGGKHATCNNPDLSKE